MATLKALQKENEALKNELKKGKGKVDEFEAKYNALIEEVQALKDDKPASNTGSDDALSNILATANEAAAGLKSLQQEWSKLDTVVKGNTDQIDSLAQYMKINTLLIHGLNNVPDCHGYDFAIYIINKINELLSAYLTFKIDLSHLEFAHFLPTKSKKKNVIIVKFASRFARNDVYKNRSKLKGSGVSITEHLTNKNLGLLKEARAIAGFVNVWTSQTKIYANLEGEVMHIKASKDLENLKAKCSTLFPDGLPEGYKAPRKDKGRRPKSRPSFRPPYNYPHRQSQMGYHQNSPAAWAVQQHPENHNSLNFASHDYPLMSQSQGSYANNNMRH